MSRRSHTREVVLLPDAPQPLAGGAVRVALAKVAVLAGASVDEQTALDTMERADAVWAENRACAAPYDPATLLRVADMCPHIAPNVDAYAQNICGYGYQAKLVEPWLHDLETDEAREAVREALEYERWVDAADQAAEDGGEGELDAAALEPVTDEEIETALVDIAATIRRERFLFSSWFDQCCSESSFTELRKKVRRDREIVGWGCMELLRDERGRLLRLAYVPAHTVRPLVGQDESVEVAEPASISPLSKGREVKVSVRLRRYVQVDGSRRVYFKAAGDPRAVSRLTGAAYRDARAMRADDRERAEAERAGYKEPPLAHELIWFGGHAADTPCSPPRWISGLLRVLGVREADETNYAHLHNKTMIGGILFLAGASIDAKMRARLERRLDQEFRGSENTSRIMVVTATPMSGGSSQSVTPQIHFQTMRDTQHTDALFTEYDARAADVLGALFRQSPLMRGYTPNNLNRATAETVLRFTEGQVYEPERETEDWIINRYIVRDIGIRFHRFMSNTPPMRSAEDVADYVSAVAPHGGILPGQIQQLTADVLNLPYEKRDENWLQYPLALAVSGAVPVDDSAAAPGAEAEDAGRMRALEERVASIVGDELRASGLEAQIVTQLFEGGRDGRR